MRFKIKGATPEIIAVAIKNFMETNGLTFDNANIYINFHKDGHAVVACMQDEDNQEYQEINGIRLDYDSTKDISAFGAVKVNFIRPTELDAIQQKRTETLLANVRRREEENMVDVQESYRLSQIGWIGLGKREKDGLYRLHRIQTRNMPEKNFIKEKKDRLGYELISFIYTEQLDKLKDRIQEEWKSQGKCERGNYRLDENDIAQFRLLGEQNTKGES